MSRSTSSPLLANEQRAADAARDAAVIFFKKWPGRRFYMAPVSDGLFLPGFTSEPSHSDTVFSITRKFGFGRATAFFRARHDLQRLVAGDDAMCSLIWAQIDPVFLG